MNAFDFVVTVALGSTLASILTSQDVAVAQGVVALALLIGLQYAITWLSVRSRHVREVTRSEPALLVHDGQPVHAALRRERITRAELDAAVRDAGVGALEDVAAVVLETDGTVTVIPSDAVRDRAARSTIPDQSASRH
jgi:uncharacterized membrane protein YcaP (DUF421 family)